MTTPLTLNNPMFAGSGPMVLPAPQENIRQTLARILSGLAQTPSAGLPTVLNSPVFTGSTPMTQPMPAVRPGTQLGEFPTGPAPTMIGPMFQPAQNTEAAVAPVEDGGILGSIISGLGRAIRNRNAAAAGEALPGTTLDPRENFVSPLPGYDQWAQELGIAPPPEGADGGLQIEFPIDQYPKPPVFDEPPGIDMDRMQSAKRSNILGALAMGAGKVDPTSAGSFARALAMAGGAGSLAAGESEEKYADIEYKNAQQAYNVAMKNKELEYEYEGKKFEMMLPQVKATEDSVIVQEFKDGKYQVRVIKTDGVLGDADKLKKTIEAMSGDGPLAEATEARYVSSLYANDPVALKTTLTRMAIERTIMNGAGAAVFGDTYDDAKSQAEARIPTGLMTDPAAYQKAFAREMSSILMSNPTTMEDTGWLEDAAKYGSVAANLLRGTGG